MRDAKFFRKFDAMRLKSRICFMFHPQQWEKRVCADNNWSSRNLHLNSRQSVANSKSHSHIHRRICEFRVRARARARLRVGAMFRFISSLSCVYIVHITHKCKHTTNCKPYQNSLIRIIYRQTLASPVNMVLPHFIMHSMIFSRRNNVCRRFK